MDSFKLLVRKDKKRADGTYSVFIRYTHNTRVKYLHTSMFASPKDLTSSFRIKNRRIIETGEKLIAVYQRRLERLLLPVTDMPFEKIIEAITENDSSYGLSFSDWVRKWMNDNKEKKGLRNYLSAYNALTRHIGRDVIYFCDFSERLMRDFERSLSDRPRAMSLYTNAIMKMYQDAREYYNNYDTGNIRIPTSLRGFKPKRQTSVPPKRALSSTQILAIAALPCRGKSTLFDLAKDCFLLSFCLLGMNSADLFTVSQYDGEYLTYHRTKTKDRRSDSALMQVRVPDILRPLIDKYRIGAKPNVVFNFSARYSDASNFNKYVNRGLKEVGAAIGVPGLQFYAARHSMATISVNEVGISPYIVNDMLCHIDESLRVTQLYIKKDFSHINEANARLLDYVFPNQATL